MNSEGTTSDTPQTEKPGALHDSTLPGRYTTALTLGERAADEQRRDDKRHAVDEQSSALCTVSALRIR